jgi:2-amino-1-hydroxyethylphosphonate dioxygenase (glycine-forming)
MEAVNKIIHLYNTLGNSEYFGEEVSKTEHMIQAAVAAEEHNEQDHVILACLLHDIGHFLGEDDTGGLGVADHGRVGANYLRDLGINELVCILVENHVLAKKYLVSKYDDYYDKLSEPSKKTLEFQGGRMTKLEMLELEKDKNLETILKIRYYDDIGKTAGLEIPNIETFKDLINKFCN